jgi:hypothetical protein
MDLVFFSKVNSFGILKLHGSILNHCPGKWKVVFNLLIAKALGKKTGFGGSLQGFKERLFKAAGLRKKQTFKKEF